MLCSFHEDSLSGMLSTLYSRSFSATKRVYCTTPNPPKRKHAKWNPALNAQLFHHLTTEIKSIKDELKADNASIKRMLWMVVPAVGGVVGGLELVLNLSGYGMELFILPRADNPEDISSHK